LLKLYGNTSGERKEKRQAIHKIFPQKTFGLKHFQKGGENSQAKRQEIMSKYQGKQGDRNVNKTGHTS
jgi:hypothetical protein